MAGYEKVVDVPLAFKVVCLSMVRYNKQDLHALARTIGKHVPPRGNGGMTPLRVQSSCLTVVNGVADHSEMTFTKPASWHLLV